MISGASRGIGAAVLRRLLDVGYESLVIGLSPPDVPSSSHTTFFHRNLSSTDDLHLAVTDVQGFLSSNGRAADLLVNNAGGGDPCTIDDLDIAAVHADLTLNLVAPMFLARAVVPGMRAAGHGSIVNVSSTAGRTGVAFLHAYSAAKAGLIAFTQSLAAEVAADGIRVNCVCPGAVDTVSARQGRDRLSRFHGLKPEEYEQRMAGRTGLARLLLPDEVADVVLYLAGDRQPALTGQTVNACGILEMR